jgi:hypothetical protein
MQLSCTRTCRIESEARGAEIDHLVRIARDSNVEFDGVVSPRGISRWKAVDGSPAERVVVHLDEDWGARGRRTGPSRSEGIAPP